MSKVQNKYALISVSDKSNIENIARSLVDLGYRILSTGGTAKYLTSMNIPNVSVSDFTEFEEILGGRVKTLHPKIHAGILAKSLKDLEDCSDVYELIDIVKEPPLVNYLNLALEQYSDDKKRIFNTRGKAFKTLDLDIDRLSKEEIIQLLLSDGKLIKRPFLIYEGKKVILGFNEIQYAKQFI